MRRNRMTNGAKVQVEFISPFRMHQSGYIFLLSVGFFFLLISILFEDYFHFLFFALVRRRFVRMCLCLFFLSLSARLYYSRSVRARDTTKYIHVSYEAENFLCVCGPAVAAPCSIRDILCLCNFFCSLYYIFIASRYRCVFSGNVDIEYRQKSVYIIFSVAAAGFRCRTIRAF